jgi:hypothetical protein
MISFQPEYCINSQPSPEVNFRVTAEKDPRLRESTRSVSLNLPSLMTCSLQAAHGAKVMALQTGWIIDR